MLCASALEGVAAELDTADVITGEVDVTDVAAVSGLVARAEESFGAVTVLVNNASMLGV